MALLSTACTSVTSDTTTESVSEDLRERTGHVLAPPEPESATGLPEGVVLTDGLTEDESVAIALWNNPDFLADLSELGLARADLLAAGLLQNPVLSLLFPSGPKQLEAALRWPLEALWQRPRRVSIAQSNVEVVASSLVQSGLSVARETKTAFADLILAKRLRDLDSVAAEQAEEIARLMGVRLRLGDISELEASAPTQAAVAAAQQEHRSRSGVSLAEDRLLALLGLGEQERRVALDPVIATAEAAAVPALERLLDDALAARPDLRAAELEVEAAANRVGLAKSERLKLTAVIDADETAGDRLLLGPGLDFELPIFDRSQAEIARAAALIEVAGRRYSATRSRIILEVRESHALLSLADQNLARHRRDLLPALAETERRVRKAYEIGELASLEVSRAELVSLGGKREEAKLVHEVAAEWAHLEASVGMNLRSLPTSKERMGKLQ